MNVEQNFAGFTEDTYKFFWELALRNEIPFFEENRKRYEEVVKRPLYLLHGELRETALEIDAGFDIRPSIVVSRIRRDTRYAPVDQPYRDHAFLSYRYPMTRLGESFVLYFEILRDSYGYGMGMYCDNPTFMNELRKRILAETGRFLSIVNDDHLNKLFKLEGVDYVRPKCPDVPETLWPWLNKRRFYYAYSSKELKKTLRPNFAGEVKQGFLCMKPLYRFIMGLNDK